MFNVFCQKKVVPLLKVGVFKQPHRFHDYFTKNIILQELLSKSKYFWSKKDITFCQVFSFCEELPDEFLDKTAVDFHFQHNRIDISQIQHRQARVTKAPKKFFCIEIASLLRFEDTAALYNPRRSDYFQKRTCLFIRQIAWTFRSFWSSQQQITDSAVTNPNRDWIHKIKRQYVCTLL